MIPDTNRCHTLQWPALRSCVAPGPDPNRARGSLHLAFMSATLEADSLAAASAASSLAFASSSASANTALLAASISRLRQETHEKITWCPQPFLLSGPILKYPPRIDWVAGSCKCALRITRRKPSPAATVIGNLLPCGRLLNGKARPHLLPASHTWKHVSNGPRVHATPNIFTLTSPQFVESLWPSHASPIWRRLSNGHVRARAITCSSISSLGSAICTNVADLDCAWPPSHAERFAQCIPREP